MQRRPSREADAFTKSCADLRETIERSEINAIVLMDRTTKTVPPDRRHVRRTLPAALGVGALVVVVLVFVQPTRPVVHGSPSWSPDGERIVYYSRRDGNSDIYVMGSDGSDPQRLTRDPASDGYPNFSPDGRSISFDTDRDGNYEIYIMDADGSNPRRLTDHPARDVSASWSPDGERIAFMSDRAGRFDVWIMDRDGSNLRRLTDFGTNWFPRWAPDGSRIAVHVGRDVHLFHVARATFARLTIDPNNGMYPTWSPDGERIAFMSWREGPTEIYVMDADGSNQRRLTFTESGDAIDPRWSPDGERIAFVHVPAYMEADGPRILYSLAVDGSDVRRLSRGAMSLDYVRSLLAEPPIRVEPVSGESG